MMASKAARRRNRLARRRRAHQEAAILENRKHIRRWGDGQVIRPGVNLGSDAKDVTPRSPMVLTVYSGEDRSEVCGSGPLQMIIDDVVMTGLLRDIALPGDALRIPAMEFKLEPADEASRRAIREMFDQVQPGPVLSNNCLGVVKAED